MYYMYGHHTYTARVRINRVRLPSNPARGLLNRETVFFLSSSSRLRIWFRETGSAVPSRVSLLISILRLNLVLTYYVIPPDFRGGVYLFVQAATRHRVSLEFIGSRNCVPMELTAESPTAQGR